MLTANSIRARRVLLLLAACFPIVSKLEAAAPRALTDGALPNDSRLAPLKDLNGYFPFTPRKAKEEWTARADRVRRQILVAEGLWPMSTKTPLNAVIHGKIDRPEYTIEKVYFESAPGFFVTGNLYRPKNVKSKVPGILFAHGHWRDARLSLLSDDALKREIDTHQEFFEHGGRSMFQSMCVQLARMGCVVWQWDMLGDSDSIQLSHALVHEFAKPRPEMNTPENWGLYSPQAEAHLQSVMGLQTWNAIRSLDFLLTLPEVDPDRVAITGASGGGTQTMILSAIDPRVKLAFPAVMVSTAMQGGCTCENASLLRVNTGNVEFAALFAPKPLGMTTANDWTKEMPTKGFPELQQLYTLLGKPENVMLARGEQFPHNYNAVSRAAFYKWLNEHFKLVPPEAAVEKDYEPLTRDQLTVWNAEHPAPKAADPDFERKLLHWFTEDADKQIRATAKSPDEFRKLAAPAIEVMIGRAYDTAGDTEWHMTEKTDRGDYLEMTGLVRNKTYSEELPVVWLYPKKWSKELSPSGESSNRVRGRGNSEPSHSGRGQGEDILESGQKNARRVVLWLNDAGKSALFNQGAPAERVKPAIQQLLDSGATVLGADLLYQGEFLKDGKPLKQTRTVQNKRESAAYTFGYNDSVFAQRAHDILTLIKFIRTAKIHSIPSPTSVAVAAFGHTGPIAAAARAVSGDVIDAAAIDTVGFRFEDLGDYRDPMFLPGGAKYLDLLGLLALGAPHRLWLAGEKTVPATVSKMYHPSGKSRDLTLYDGIEQQEKASAVKWLLQ